MRLTCRRLLLPSVLAAVLAIVQAAPVRALDAVPTGNVGALELGRNWQPLETYRGASFRWVNNDAELVVRAQTPLTRIDIACSAGPSLGKGAALVRVLDEQHRQVDHVMCAGSDQLAEMVLPTRPGTSRFFLHVDGGGRPVPGDHRILNLQVFALDISDGSGNPGDVVAGNGVKLGAHWFGPEFYQGQTFRWMNGNDGEIVLSMPSARHATLHLIAEAGPSVGAFSTLLTIRERGGATVFKRNVGAKAAFIVPLALRSGQTVLVLHVRSRELPVPHDPRRLDLRLFGLWLQ